MITVDQGCPKCHAANTYLRQWSSKQGSVMERHCTCGWTRTEQIRVGDVVSLPFTPAEAAKMMTQIEAKALKALQAASKGGRQGNGLKAMHRVKNGLHKPYKTYKRRERVIHDSDFEADPDTI